MTYGSVLGGKGWFGKHEMLTNRRKQESPEVLEFGTEIIKNWIQEFDGGKDDFYRYHLPYEQSGAVICLERAYLGEKKGIRIGSSAGRRKMHQLVYIFSGLGIVGPSL